MGADRSEKARGHKSDMDVGGESHSFIVPKKPANKGRFQSLRSWWREGDWPRRTPSNRYWTEHRAGNRTGDRLKPGRADCWVYVKPWGLHVNIRGKNRMR